jgi:hypothetical protein
MKIPRRSVQLAARSFIRSKNIKLVNKFQKRNTSETFDLKNRYLDIYARYGHGEMDPFMLSIVTMTADWYVYGSNSTLFNKIRIIPYDRDAFPWIAKASSPKAASMYDLNGKSFRQSNLGANRIYFTHSDSRESSDLFSIPIVGYTTFDNFGKIGVTQFGVVQLKASFDTKDLFRHVYPMSSVQKNKTRPDFADDIPGLINETIRALIEVEKRQILAAENY